MRSLDEWCIYNGRAIRSFPPRRSLMVAFCVGPAFDHGQTGHYNESIVFSTGRAPKEHTPNTFSVARIQNDAATPSVEWTTSQRTHAQVHRPSPSPARTFATSMALCPLVLVSHPNDRAWRFERGPS